MIEMPDPAQTERYRTVVTPANWKRFLSMMEAGAAPA
jgi:hypothetical protein